MLNLNSYLVDQVNDLFFLFITHIKRLITKVQIQGRHGSKNKKNLYILRNYTRNLKIKYAFTEIDSHWIQSRGLHAVNRR